jgi:uncharacterized membrane protein HdeD (DUF308 family)
VINKKFPPQLTPIQWQIAMYLIAIFFGTLAILEPNLAYQVIGLIIGLYGLAYGGLFAYRLYFRIKDRPDVPHLSIGVIIGVIAIGVLLIFIPLTLLKQTIGIALVIGLFSIAAYQLYFIRRQFINPLTWKNYLIGISAIIGAILILFFVNEISDLLMILLGISLVVYSAYRLITLLTK